MCQFFEIHNFDSWCNTALKNLNHYSRADDRYIFTLKEHNAIIGFAVVNKHLRFNTDGFCVAEFYIQKGHEKKGHGRRLAKHIFTQFKGVWEVAVSLKNKPALAFWEQVVSLYTKNNFTKKKTVSFDGYGFLFNTAGETVDNEHSIKPEKIDLATA